MLSIRHRWAVLSAIALLAAAGCGSSSSHGSGGPPAAQSSGSSTSAAGGSATPGALSGEAASAATGDIPDNQVFLDFVNRGAGYSIKYPEGWTQRGSRDQVTFQDKNNLVRIFLAPGAAPTTASVTAQLDALRRRDPSLTFTPPRPLQIHSATAIKATYSTKSPPDPVTGKRVTLRVDRYELAHNGRVAVVDLGTPVGVDNVDAYRKMIESFTWR